MKNCNEICVIPVGHSCIYGVQVNIAKPVDLSLYTRMT